MSINMSTHENTNRPVNSKKQKQSSLMKLTRSDMYTQKNIDRGLF